MKYYVSLLCLLCCFFLSCKTFSKPNEKEKKHSYQTSDMSLRESTKLNIESNEYSEKALQSESYIAEKRIIDINYTVAAMGNNPKGGETSVITNTASLIALYRRIYGSDSVEPPLVDFSKQVVVAVFAGKFNTGGYTINLHSASKSSDGIILNFQVISPSRDQIVTQALTKPFIILICDILPSDNIKLNVTGLENDILLMGDYKNLTF